MCVRTRKEKSDICQKKKKLILKYIHLHILYYKKKKYTSSPARVTFSPYRSDLSLPVFV